MATSLLAFQSTGIRACASPGHRKPNLDRRKPSSSNWWNPIFGWSSDSDYIDGTNKSNDVVVSDHEIHNRSELHTTRSRLSPGGFTEEKAKQLRMMTTETSTFHDIMYHSAIASRLASDLSNRSSSYGL